MEKHAELTGMVAGWSEDDYVVLDGGRSVGRIHKDRSQAEETWFWAINTTPFPAPVPHCGYAKSLEEVTAAFKERYEEMKAQGVRPFADH
jgi:hypothetical protein